MQSGWISTKDRLPEADGKMCIVATLGRYDNARWEWQLSTAYFGVNKKWMNDDGYYISTPDYWMEFPREPEITPEEIKQSEACFQSERTEKINSLKEEIKQLEDEIETSINQLRKVTK